MEAIIHYLCVKFEHHQEMHVREMVEDVFNIGFFTTKMAAS